MERSVMSSPVDLVVTPQRSAQTDRSAMVLSAEMGASVMRTVL